MTNPSKENEFWYYAHKGETLRELAGSTNNPTQIRRKAKKCFEEAIDLKPDNSWAIARCGLLDRQMGNLDKAEAAFENLKNDYPGNPWVFAQLGETYRLLFVRTSSTDPTDLLVKKAIENFEHAIDLYKKLNDQDEYLWAYAHLGATYLYIENFDTALEYLEKAIDLAEDGYAWAWACKAKVYYDRKDFEKADACIQTAKTLDRRVVPSADFQRGLLAYLNGEPDRAIELFNRELQEDVDNTLALYGIALVTVRTKGVKEAKTEIDKAEAVLIEHKNNSENQYMLAALAYLQNQTDQALKYIKSAIAATNSIQDIFQNSEVSESMNRVLANVQSGNLSWLGLDFDEDFHNLISQAK